MELVHRCGVTQVQVLRCSNPSAVVHGEPEELPQVPVTCAGGAQVSGQNPELVLMLPAAPDGGRAELQSQESFDILTFMGSLLKESFQSKILFNLRLKHFLHLSN